MNSHNDDKHGRWRWRQRFALMPTAHDSAMSQRSWLGPDSTPPLRLESLQLTFGGSGTAESRSHIDPRSSPKKHRSEDAPVDDDNDNDNEDDIDYGDIDNNVDGDDDGEEEAEGDNRLDENGKICWKETLMEAIGYADVYCSPCTQSLSPSEKSFDELGLLVMNY